MSTDSMAMVDLRDLPDRGIHPALAALWSELREFRRDLHAHPELAYRETRTAGRVTDQLRAAGLEVDTGLAETGVVATLRLGAHPERRRLLLRADMDALPMGEANEFAHRSTTPGRMHACGHDGHTTMLLGAARHLAAERERLGAELEGTVYFCFQPAEEVEGGAARMVAEGLFERYPADAIYALHNWPGLAAGHFAVTPGPIMAAIDLFDLRVRGRGAHAAMPHQGADAIVAASQLVTALQTLSSRSADPQDAVVVSVTQFHAGDAYNVLPEEVILRGTVRTFGGALQDQVEAGMRRIAGGVAAAMGVSAELDYRRCHPATVSTEAEAETAAAVATALVGADRVDRAPVPSMGAEDFSEMLAVKPGCYLWIGNGVDSEGGCMLHNPRYDFNDAILPLGASFWVALVERELRP